MIMQLYLTTVFFVGCIGCGIPDKVLNGTRTFTGTATGDTADYICATGFTLTGDSTLICLSSAAWDHSFPFCVINECDELSSPSNGFVDTSQGTSYGQNAVYSCDEGYAVNANSSVRQCLANGEWELPELDCVIDCGPPTVPVYGGVSTPDGTVFKSKAYFSCLNGKPSTKHHVCQAQGQWVGSTPSCVKPETTTPTSTLHTPTTTTTTVSTNTETTHPSSSSQPTTSTASSTTATTSQLPTSSTVVSSTIATTSQLPTSSTTASSTTATTSQLPTSLTTVSSTTATTSQLPTSSTTASSTTATASQLPTSSTVASSTTATLSQLPTSSTTASSTTATTSQVPTSTTTNSSTTATTSHLSTSSTTASSTTATASQLPTSSTTASSTTSTTSQLPTSSVPTVSTSSSSSVSISAANVSTSVLSTLTHGLVTSTPLSTTLESPTEPIYIMPCICNTNRTFFNMTEEQIIAKLITDTKIDTKSTTLAESKLKCRSDSRTSAKIAGMFGVVFITTIFGIMFIADLINLYEYIKYINMLRSVNVVEVV